MDNSIGNLGKQLGGLLQNRGQQGSANLQQTPTADAANSFQQVLSTWLSGPGLRLAGCLLAPQVCSAAVVQVHIFKRHRLVAEDGVLPAAASAARQQGHRAPEHPPAQSPERGQQPGQAPVGHHWRGKRCSSCFAAAQSSDEADTQPPLSEGLVVVSQMHK